MRIDEIRNKDIRDMALAAAHQVLAKSADMQDFAKNLPVFLDVTMSDPNEPRVLGSLDVDDKTAVIVQQVWTDGKGRIIKSCECIHHPSVSGIDALALNAARNDINTLVIEALNEEKEGTQHRPYYEFFSQFEC